MSEHMLKHVKTIWIYCIYRYIHTICGHNVYLFTIYIYMFSLSLYINIYTYIYTIQLQQLQIGQRFITSSAAADAAMVTSILRGTPADHLEVGRMGIQS